MTLTKEEAVKKLLKIYIEHSDDSLVLYDTDANPLITEVFEQVPDEDQGLVYHMFQHELKIEMLNRGVYIQGLDEGSLH